VDQTVLARFIDDLALPEAVKVELKALTPETYLGYAKSF
jgi:adenylosuccinate lyase